jgi:hypothetical protein
MATFELRQVKDRHHIVIDMMLSGMSNIDIAKETGYTKEYISAIRNSPIVRLWLQELQGERHVQASQLNILLQKDAINSFNLLRDIRDGKEPADVRVRAKVATELLDRSGLLEVPSSEGNKVDTSVITLVMQRVEEIRATIPSHPSTVPSYESTLPLHGSAE